MPILPRLVLFWSTILCSIAIAQEPPNILEIAQAARGATAMVQIDEQPVGTAFCIHPLGYYLTNDHVFRQSLRSVALVVNAGEAGETILAAEILRRDASADLALLKVAQDGAPHLRLGQDEDLVETMDVLALGFPFGSDLSIVEGTRPTVSINAGRVTALRKAEGLLEEIQFDAQVNPGSSGGPLIRTDGSVIGIVTKGMQGVRVNAAVAVRRIRAFLDRPEIVRDFPATLDWAQRYEPARFGLRMLNLAGGPALPFQFELLLDDGATEQSLDGAAEGEDLYAVLTAPMEAPAGRGPRARIRYQGNIFVGDTQFSNLSADGQPVEAETLQYYAKSPALVLRLASGDQRTLSTPLSGMASIAMAGQEIQLPVDEVDLIEIINPPYTPELRYEARLLRDGAVVQSVAGSIPWSGFPAELAARPVEVTASLPEDSGPGLSGDQQPRAPGISDFPPVTGIELPEASFAGELFEFKLPAAFSSVTPAGAGRYLLFVLQSVRKLAVFDVTSGTVAAYVPLPEGIVDVAGGANYFYILDSGTSRISRYNLATFELERSQLAPVSAVVVGIAMGAVSNGPLLLACREGNDGKLFALNVNTLTEAAPLDTGDRISDPVSVNLSANGETAVVTGHKVISIVAGKVASRNNFQSDGYAMPGPDGRAIYTSRGVLNALASPANAQANTGAAIPTTSPHFYIRLPGQLNRSEALPGRVMLTSGDLPVALLPSLDEMADPEKPEWANNGNHWRVRFVEQAGVLVTLPKPNDRVLLRRFNIREVLEASDIDYLFVYSENRKLATPGQRLEYPLGVASRHGDLLYQVDAGTPEMRISDAGLFAWDVPTTQTKPETVIVRVTDGVGQIAYHVFTIGLGAVQAGGEAQ